MEGSPNQDAESPFTVIATVAALTLGRIARFAVRAGRLVTPAHGLEVGNAMFLRGEPIQDFYNIHVLCHIT